LQKAIKSGRESQGERATKLTRSLQEHDNRRPSRIALDRDAALRLGDVICSKYTSGEFS